MRKSVVCFFMLLVMAWFSPSAHAELVYGTSLEDGSVIYVETSSVYGRTNSDGYTVCGADLSYKDSTCDVVFMERDGMIIGQLLGERTFVDRNTPIFYDLYCVIQRYF